MDLKKGYESGKNHAFRKRCHVILLKSENRKSKDVAAILKMDTKQREFAGFHVIKTKAWKAYEPRKGGGEKPFLTPKKIGRRFWRQLKSTAKERKAPKRNLSKKQVKKFLLIRLFVF